MKNEPWIDQVYKEKTESWKIPVQPAHWEQAAALIDAQNQRKKKRVIWLWLLGLALISASLFLFFNNDHEVSQPPFHHSSIEPWHRSLPDPLSRVIMKST